jgi:hypothetical protein
MFAVEPTNHQYTPMIVNVNGSALTGVDTTYGVYTGSTAQFKIELGSGYATPSNIKVYVNGVLKSFLVDYVFNEEMTLVTIDSLVINDVVLIENNSNAEYSINGNTLIISSELTTNDVVNVVWFTQYQTMQLLTDEHVGGKASYALAMKPIDSSYVWVYVNGVKLTPIRDYYLSDDKTKVYLLDTTSESDMVKVVLFGSKLCSTKSYEISKDMLNVFRYNRYSIGTIQLAKDLNYYDTEILVTDASLLSIPVAARNQPGTVLINGERIEYLMLTDNTLSQLRRGSMGTAIAELYTAGTDVADVSIQERIPYNETEMKESFMIDGSTRSVGPLSYIPVKSVRTNWAAGNIPTGYGPCDQVEVFVGGRRLRKNPMHVFNESLGSTSPRADELLDAEFSVDGTSNYIRLTDSVLDSIPVNASVNVVVYRKVGKVWYEQTATAASAGITLLENNTPMAKFISQKTTAMIG